ncbi:CaiB/BaiF CoA transferase family protein [Nocardia cyriacigeorgica]|uniref:CaiB/BaiF CoA transferase family protein n=1 Tax=Nocardia cyriacigeorgica TaxID=135487 RepID=UPI0013D7C1D9|nr:CoA transferase [Nocardia cyriacigeorgica]NEW27114.1 CoA transferase [Nocardia cyriacigeorgica]
MAALSGVTVLDLGQVYLGPYCSMLLARLGADVIKIEPPGGEAVRLRRTEEPTAAFALLNAGKRGVRLDLKTERGRELLKRLVVDADVLVENYAPGAMNRLGLSYDVLREINPRLVYASGTGYGSTGPNAHLKAMDLTIQATTGVMAVTGFADRPPVKSGIAVADFMGGVHLAAGVLAALVERDRTGVGTRVEVSMQDAVLPSLTSNLSGYLDSDGTAPERTGNRHGGLGVAPYNVYPTMDGWVAVLGISDRHWTALCGLMGRPELDADPRFTSNEARVQWIDDVDDYLQGWTSQHSTDKAVALLEEAGVPCAPVRSLKSLFDDPHLRERGMLAPVTTRGGNQQWVFGSPVRVGDVSVQDSPGEAPRLGQDTDDVLRERLGIDTETLGRLRRDGVI